jgi:uncharacterized protein YcbX
MRCKCKGVEQQLTFGQRFDIVMTAYIQHLFVYPIKSLTGISCEYFDVTDRGARQDRRWMLVDERGRFISQREWPQLCLFGLTLAEGGFEVRAPVGSAQQSEVRIPHSLESGQTVLVDVWSDSVQAIAASAEINHFFSRALSMNCRLVYMPDVSHRPVDRAYSTNGELTSFADAYPLLLIGSASLDALNTRLLESNEPALGWDRFRPNIVAATQQAHCEDEWAEFVMGEVQASGVKLCSRCVLTTINQADGSKGKEPLRTLSTYRNIGGKVMFGQNVIAHEGRVRVGDALEVREFGYPANAKS